MLEEQTAELFEKVQAIGRQLSIPCVSTASMCTDISYCSFLKGEFVVDLNILFKREREREILPAGSSPKCSNIRNVHIPCKLGLKLEPVPQPDLLCGW